MNNTMNNSDENYGQRPSIFKKREQHESLCSKLRGFYQYFWVWVNYKVLEVVVFEYAEKAWRHRLGRRLRDGYISSEKFSEILEIFPLPSPRIVHNV